MADDGYAAGFPASPLFPRAFPPAFFVLLRYFPELKDLARRRGQIDFAGKRAPLPPKGPHHRYEPFYPLNLSRLVAHAVTDRQDVTHPVTRVAD